ncbi:hypothetical protein Afil01_08370 [Actinorhabdospora filicis]|uniref:non-specific serine/threonine protein kinase n=1 Tax=Actinorhabdospora filicis TaxID=1785913 RepID=A0A9W6SF49_9ACTN|nr:serine/threonine-protein kinase [Actinorhabdospora filicis]GLZ76030.1 hypothetical protein Afil01_08370 [Actinorhabdospora filicis]
MTGNLAAGPDIPGYRDLQLIAHGSTALVFKARQERLDRDVAIKVLSVDEVMTTHASVAKELETTVALSAHPHIVSIIDTGTTMGGQPYIVMEYCEGGSYSQILKANGPLPVADVVEVGVKIGEALHAAHSVSILHRDVKPQNILRTKFGPALADFGIARAADELAATGTIDKLTPLHSAPEALRRDEQSPASDVYSLASTMWHLLVGRGPFSNPNGRTDPDEFRQRVEYSLAPSVPRADVPDWLQRVLARGLAKDPAARHQSAYAFAEELRRHSYGAIGTGAAGAASVATPAGPTDDEMTAFVFPTTPTRHPGAPTDPFAAAAPAYAPPPPPPAYSPPAPRPQAYQPYTPPPVEPEGTMRVGPPGPAVAPTLPPAHPPAPSPVPAHAPESQGSRAPLILGLTGAVLALVVLIGVIVFVVPGLKGGDKANDPPKVDGTVGLSSFDAPPSDLTIVTDDQNGVRLSWGDPSAGSLSFIIFGGRKGEAAEAMQTITAGTTTATISGLNPEANYCFMVGALYSIDSVPRSNQACTSRS